MAITKEEWLAKLAYNNKQYDIAVENEFYYNWHELVFKAAENAIENADTRCTIKVATGTFQHIYKAYTQAPELVYDILTTAINMLNLQYPWLNFMFTDDYLDRNNYSILGDIYISWEAK